MNSLAIISLKGSKKRKRKREKHKSGSLIVLSFIFLFNGLKIATAGWPIKLLDQEIVQPS